MYKSYLVSAFRNFSKNKFNSLLNIVGLSIGIAVCLFILSYVFYETGYDRFLPNSDRIYRLVGKYHYNGRESESPFTVGKVGSEAIKQIPGIESMFRIHHYGGSVLEYQNFKNSNYSIAFVDPGFLEIFQLPFKSGSAGTALMETNSAVLTAQVAEALFGAEDPYGKTVKIDGKNFKVTGILEKLPGNFHLNVFDVFCSISSVITPEFNIVEVEGTHFPTYFLLSEGVNIDDFSQKLDVLAKGLVEERFSGYGMEVENYLQPLANIHLRSGLSYDYSKSVNVSYLYLFSALALFIIMIAVVNFINLTTAIYEKRSKEVGVRKVVGAHRLDLIFQFLSESILITLFSLVMALILVEVFSSAFTDLIGFNIPVIYYQTPILILVILLFILFIGFVSGIYPAFYLSKIKPVKAIKGIRQSNTKSVNIRKVLMVFQFSISIFIIITLLLLFRQMDYVKNKDFGFDKENVYVLKNLTDEIRNSYPYVKAELLQIPEILYVTASQSVPGGNRESNDIVHEVDEPKETGVLFNINRIQHDYLSTYGIKLLEGRDFSKENSLDIGSAIINESGVKNLGLEKPIGKRVKIDDNTLTVIGVVKDYNVNSLHRAIEPVLLNMQSTWYRYISIKSNKKDMKELMNKVKSVFEKADPNYVFDYYEVEASYRQMYKAEDRLFKLFAYASVLAIIISILGLYALTAYTIHSKYKEIGIRKTFGASVKSITISLVNRLTIWVIIANIIAWPVAYYFITEWLQKFEFRINVLRHWWVFLSATLIVYILSAVTVYFQSSRAANINPVESLKYE